MVLWYCTLLTSSVRYEIVVPRQLHAYLCALVEMIKAGELGASARVGDIALYLFPARRARATHCPPPVICFVSQEIGSEFLGN